ncbi:non-ribosomal peptide synthetase [Paraflavitalea soli]|uniref:non-ribosomal peptide synthetase n=1 Tax=Paraflavitalea soli TaxID=2315862 RepID=UPI0013C40340|nr:non-ribosomal peptide synthetase [Paraflavitalea soli]
MSRIPQPAISYAQERTWQAIGAGQAPCSNIPVLVALKGAIDRQQLEAALWQVLNSAAVVSAGFREEAGKLEAFTGPQFDEPLSITTAASFKEARELAIPFVLAPFDVQQGRLVRYTLYRIHQEDHYLLALSFHRLVCDPWSVRILLDQLVQVLDGKGTAPAQPISFFDFARWQKSIPEDAINNLYAYWKRKLHNNIEPLSLFNDLPRRITSIYTPQQTEVTISGASYARLTHFLKVQPSDKRDFFLAVFTILLHNYCRQESVICGLPVPNREVKGTETLIGPVANLLPINTKISREEKWSDLLKKITLTTSNALQYQSLPYEVLVNKLNPVKEAVRSPLFDVLFRFEEAYNAKAINDSVELTVYPLHAALDRYDLDVLVTENPAEGHCRLQLCYNAGYYSEALMRQFIRHYQQLIHTIIEQGDREIGYYQYITAVEQDTILHHWNKRNISYPADTHIIMHFKNAVTHYPERTAISFNDQSLTYRDLDQLSDALAVQLIGQPSHNDQLIGLLSERSIELIVGILAILKAGKAYLPLDPGLPVNRLNYLVADSRIDLLLVYEQESRPAPDLPGKKIRIDLATLRNEPAKVYAWPIKPDSLAYVLYTSGTTGNPKGVMIGHEQVVRLFFHEGTYFDFRETDVWSMFFTCSFDFSVWEIWGALFYGGELVIVPREVTMNQEAFTRLLIDKQVTILNQTPTSFYSLSKTILAHQQPGALAVRKIIFGGEALNPAKLADFRKQYPATQLINMYGITETTVHNTYKEITHQEITAGASNIGTPLPTVNIYLLDAAMKLVPPGVAGEMYIGGKGLAKGYWGKEDLTLAKFIPHPWATGEKLYKTGDLARWLSHGELEFLGRIDNQIQIRGYRVELEEVLAVLLRTEQLRDVFVCARGEDTDKIIYAYVVDDRQVNTQQIRTNLAAHLPGYMIPGIIIQVDDFPLTSNGKIAIDALPLQEATAQDSMALPENPIEEQLLQLFAEVLNLKKDRISTTRSFFDLGGHSLKATRLVNKIKDRLGVELRVTTIFDNPDVKGLAQQIGLTKTKAIPLTKAPVREYYPLSPSQRRIYILQKMYEDAFLYHISNVYKLQQVDLQKLRNALNQLVLRHEALRTRFDIRENIPVQIIEENVQLLPDELYCKQAALQQVIQQWIKPFDLATAPLMRVAFLHTDEGNQYLVFNLHHIITDGISNAVFLRDFVSLYKGETLPALPFQFKDFSTWVHAQQSGEQWSNSKAFWLNKFAGELPDLALPLDFKRPMVKDFSGSFQSCDIDKTTTHQIQAVCRQLGISAFSFLLTAYLLLLRKVTGQEDIVVGSPGAGRYFEGLQDTTGIFINVLAHRNHPIGNKRCDAFMQEVNKHSLDILQHQDYQFEDLVDQLVKVRDTSRSPLFDVMFDYHNEENLANEIALEGVQVANEEAGFTRSTSMFDLNLHVYEHKDHFRCELDYSTQLFKPGTIASMVDMLVNIIRELAAHPQQTIAAIEPLSLEERHRILFDLNDTKRSFNDKLLLHQCFEQVAALQPDAMAVICQGEVLTYGALNRLANKLAHALRQQELAIEGCVAIMMDRSLEMVPAVMGVLKAGGMYVPIEPHLPDNRIETLISLLNIRYMITTTGQLQRAQHIFSAAGEDKKLFCIEVYAAVTGQEGASLSYIPVHPGTAWSEENLPANTTPDHHAYVIFTSGSTGVPKGVMVKHKPVVNVIEWVNRELKVTPEDKLLFITSLGFDLSVYDIFGTLAAGAMIRLVTREEMENQETLLKIINEEQITIWDSAPAAIQQLLPELATTNTSQSTLRLIMLSGDWIPVALPDVVRKHFKACEVISLGGATEAAIWSNYYRIGAVDPNWASIPYGKPIQNARYYVLDAYAMPCPIGIPGDLYIGGDCLATGYIGDKALTEKKFIPNPFVQGEKMYLTGDTARWMADGNMEFLGRKDTQVKIRGHRIELGEIESCFRKCTGLTEILAIPVALGGAASDKQLCVYYCSEQDWDKNELKARMGQELPAYMVPAYFVRLDRFPVNQNGKVDRKKLPAPHAEQERKQAPVVLNAVHQKLIAICADTLQLPVEKIDIRDNFFELGGHSLNSTYFLNRVRSEFGVRVPLVDFFRQDSLLELANSLPADVLTPVSSLPRTLQKEYYNLSSAQLRLLILHQLDSDNIGYGFNIPLVFNIDGVLDIERVNQVFRQLINRHESLRTSFHIVAETPVQRIHAQVNFAVETISVASTTDTEGAIKDFIRGFDLQQAPLLRAGVVYHQQSPVAMIIDMHHIISDGVSQQVLAAEFMDLYTGKELAPLALQYKDYAEWQFSEKRSAAMEKQKQFWINQFAREPQYIELPTDFQQGAIRQYTGRTSRFMIPKDQAARLYQLAGDSGGTLFTTLLAMLNILLAKLSGQQDITIGTVTAGRNNADLEKITGIFLNTLAMRNYPAGELSLNTFLSSVAANTLQAFDHQDYPYESLVNELKLGRNSFQNPLFNVVFILQNMGKPAWSIPGLRLEAINFDYGISKMDMTFICTEQEEALYFDLEYSTTLFKEATIQRFIQYFTTIIDQACATPHMTIGEINLLDQAARDMIIKTFNNTRQPINRDACYHQLFEQWVHATPGAIACIHNEATITYEQLNGLANRLAAWMVKQGAAPGKVVAICFNRGIELLAAIMGVLKTGASYIAIDTEYPAKRIGDILAQSEAGIAIVQQDMAATFNKLREETPTLTTILSADDLAALHRALGDYPAHDLTIRFDTDTTAYIIYTSGTTGKPKGIMVHQLGMLNHMYALISRLGITDKDVMAQTASCSSDIFVVQLLMTLITGGAVCIIDKEDVLDPVRLQSIMNAARITLMEIVPSLLTVFLETLSKRSDYQLHSLRAMLSMGESLKSLSARKWYDLYPQIDLYNAYGPAEASDDVSLFKIDPAQIVADAPVSIGYPLDNLHIYIMDSHLNLCPIGVLGEICVSGIAVGKGYWREEEKTRAVFVENPLFAYIGDEDYRMLYKTGDLGYWQPDGSLIFDKRKDHMVKIRGFRVEPGDIENALLNLTSIKEAIVIDRQYENGTKYLCAYYVSDEQPDRSWIRQQLLAVLPGYMVPSYFIQMDKLPITANDKIDRKALPAPDTGSGMENPEKTILGPATATEAILVPIWRSVLGIDAIGTDQGFFDFGGDSIKAINLRSRMEASGLAVSIKDIYQYTSIRDLAARVDEKIKSITDMPEKKPAPLREPVATAGRFDYNELTEEDLDSIFE